MYSVNPLLGDIQPDELAIWRYMDLGKYVDLLRRRELFFVRLGILADDADFYEGAFPQLNFDQPEIAAEWLAQVLNHPENDPSVREAARRYAMDPSSLVQNVELVRRSVYVLCWHANEYESAAMWKLYLQGGEGVAIRSTIGRLKTSLDAAPGEQWIQRVRYYDPERHPVPLDILEIPLWKRISFAHEREIRAVVMDTDPASRYESTTNAGVYVSCNLDELVDCVYVAPTSPQYFLEGVQAISERFGLDKHTHRSVLDARPGAPAVG